MTIEALFEFIADNPISLLIAGGILCFILGAFVLPISQQVGYLLVAFGIILIIIGTLLFVYVSYQT